MRRWWSAALLLLAGLLPTVVGLPAAAAAPPAAPAPAPGPGPVVVVGVPDLRWQDLDPTTTPTLWSLAGRSSVAAMTDDSAERTAHRATGWLTLNTGSRAAAHVKARQLPDPRDPSVLSRLHERNANGHFGAQVGALGDALRHAGLTTAAVGGPGAVLGAMAGDGTVGAQPDTVAEALTSADVVTVELPELYDAGRRNPAAVRDARRVVDDRLSGLLRQLPQNASLLVVGVSDAATGPAHLHVALASGPQFGRGLLTSPTTGRTGVVQLIDVAPTILWLAGVPAPAGMLGVHWQGVPGASASFADQVRDFVELDQRSALVLAAVSGWYYPAVVGLVVAYVVAVLVAWRRRRTGFLRPLGAVVAAVPVASYLMQLVPWWRAGAWPMAPLTVGIALVVGGFGAWLPWARRGRWRTAGIVAGVTAAVVTLDAATGSPLSLDGPFADNPIIAGRFHGLGNVAFALLGSGTLVLAAALGGRLRASRAGALVLALGLCAVVVDGYPGLGDDFGGVPALLAAVAVLGLRMARVRIRWRHAFAVLGLIVVAVAGFSLYDYSRPASERTHLGRFVAQVADGSAETVVLRKLSSSVGTITGGWGRYIFLCWVVLAVVAYVLLRRGRLRAPSAVDRHTAGALLTALVVLGIVGAALNDSGLEIPAFAFFLAAPLLVPLLAVAPEGAGEAVLPFRDRGTVEPSSTVPHSSPGGG